MCIRFVIGSLIALVTVAPSLGQTPLTTAFTYQGQLKENGAPIDGTAHLRFSLWDAAGNGSPPVGGRQIGASQLLANVPVGNGLFTVLLNGAGEFGGNAFHGGARWLQVEVCADAGCRTSTILAPRQPLTAAPHALFALNASAATTAATATNATTATTAANATQLNGQPATFYQDASSINSGTLADARLSSNVAHLDNAQTFAGAKTFSLAPAFSAAGAPFSVTGTTKVTNLNADLLDGLNSTAFLQSIPVPLTLTGTSVLHIIKGENTSTILFPRGLHGAATGATGVTIGVLGESASTSGTGVAGRASAATGTTYGVSGQSDSPSGSGVYGTSVDNVGVYGVASGRSGLNYGGWFESDSTSGRGVYGLASAASGLIYGVLGQASTASSGFGVFASGDTGASGVKLFRIDHPDDPGNKYLLHYATESPEVINFYRGTVVLDGAGEAVVELPHYFAKINKTPSYQLTAVGAPMPMLHVAEEIDEAALSVGATAGAGVAAPICSFRIAGGAPGAKVSWRVEALRNDLWVQNRAVPVEALRNGLSIQTRAMPVEVEKQGLEKGTYQHPEFYGQPPEKGMNYDATRAERDLHNQPDTERPASRTLPAATPQ